MKRLYINILTLLREFHHISSQDFSLRPPKKLRFSETLSAKREPQAG